MATQTVSRAMAFGASQSRNNAGVMRLVVGQAQFLDIARPLYDMLVRGEVDSVTYDDTTTPLPVTNATTGEVTNIQFHRVNGVNENMIVRIERASRFSQVANDFDEKAYAAAMKKMEGVVI